MSEQLKGEVTVLGEVGDIADYASPTAIKAENGKLLPGHHLMAVFVDDTAFILLSRGELITASSRNEDSKTEAMHFPRPRQESSVADMEDIEKP
jgi:hypothetical protein